MNKRAREQEVQEGLFGSWVTGYYGSELTISPKAEKAGYTLAKLDRGPDDEVGKPAPSHGHLPCFSLLYWNLEPSHTKKMRMERFMKLAVRFNMGKEKCFVAGCNHLFSLGGEHRRASSAEFMHETRRIMMMNHAQEIVRKWHRCDPYDDHVLMISALAEVSEECAARNSNEMSRINTQATAVQLGWHLEPKTVRMFEKGII
jgi:hypothetical protein